MFIQVIQGRCTRHDELREATERWHRDVAPGAIGYLGATYGITDDDTAVAVVRFESKEAAQANSARPEQGEWWGGMQKLFDGPVEFRDCDDVTVMLQGGSDDAGFVQVMQGRTDDPERLRAMVTDVADLQEARPEIIGATLALEPDGRFTQTVAFTDEASARRGEQQEMPEDVRDAMESLMLDLTYLDLHDPWFR